MDSDRSTSVADNQTANRALLNDFNDILEQRGTEVEFYFMGGAVLFQAFNSRPGTAHISEMFRPAGVVHDASAELARQVPLSDDWLQGGVGSVLGGAAQPGSFLELSHVSVFVPLPAYVLAVKCAAMRLGADFAEMEDIRYVLRAMNITTPDQAMSVVTQYFAESQLATHTRAALEELLGA